MDDRFAHLLKSMVGLHMRYLATTATLLTSYISDLREAIRDSDITQPPPPSPPPKRTPILLVGRLHDEASGAFVVNNTSGSELIVDFVVGGDLQPSQIVLDPSFLELSPGASAFVRLSVKISGQLQQNRDYRVFVTIPKLSAEAVTFLVRRLSDSPIVGMPPAMGPLPGRRKASPSGRRKRKTVE